MSKNVPPPPPIKDDTQVLRSVHEWPHCSCELCVKKRTDHACIYTGHEMVDAWREGFEKGAAFGRRVP
jgi:hypothetical protein